MKDTILKDSGSRSDFGTGAVRDARIGKGRTDLMPLPIIKELFDHPTIRISYKKFSETNSTALQNIHLFMFGGDSHQLILAIIDIIAHNREYFQEHVQMAQELECTIPELDAPFSEVLASNMISLSRHFEQGALKYGERNWEKGIPLHYYIDSALRHYFKMQAGFADENHHLACLWNLMCAIWVCRYGEEKLFDLPFSQESMKEVCKKVI